MCPTTIGICSTTSVCGPNLPWSDDAKDQIGTHEHQLGDCCWLQASFQLRIPHLSPSHHCIPMVPGDTPVTAARQRPDRTEQHPPRWRPTATKVSKTMQAQTWATHGQISDRRRSPPHGKCQIAPSSLHRAGVPQQRKGPRRCNHESGQTWANIRSSCELVTCWFRKHSNLRTHVRNLLARQRPNRTEQHPPRWRSTATQVSQTLQQHIWAGIGKDHIVV